MSFNKNYDLGSIHSIKSLHFMEPAQNLGLSHISRRRYWERRSERVVLQRPAAGDGRKKRGGGERKHLQHRWRLESPPAPEEMIAGEDDDRGRESYPESGRSRRGRRHPPSAGNVVVERWGLGGKCLW